MPKTQATEEEEVQVEKKFVNHQDIIDAKFPEREGYKLRKNFLWQNKEGVSFYRINYLNYEHWKHIESHFVLVNTEGVVKEFSDQEKVKKSYDH